MPKPIDAPSKLLPRRLPDVDFPQYRFVPGLQEHPNVSQDHQNACEVPIEQCWDYGMDLYENHFWWEAHEVWERLWLELPLDSDEKWSKEHPQRRYIQGHILLSASKLLSHLGRPSTSMKQKAEEYIRCCDTFLYLS